MILRFRSPWLLIALFACSPFLLGSGPLQAQTTYYIDQESLGGPCNDNGPGSLTQPWCSWSQKFWNDRQTLDPGDTVFIRGGVYQQRFAFHPDSSFSGTADDPIRIRSYPGEEVTFDGSGPGGNGLYVDGDNSYIHIIGPLEIRNFSNCMETQGAVTNHGWLLEFLDVHSCGRGLLIRNIEGLTLRNSTIHHTNTDGGAGGVYLFSGSTNITIENVVSHSHNDGRGVDGDGDGFWAHESTGVLVMKNVVAYGNSEDGFDLKAADVTIENGRSYDNSTVGFKFWLGNYKVSKFLTYNNGEDGLKCSSASFDFSQMTVVGNLESGLQFRSVGCSGVLRNSIFANNRISAVEIPRINSGRSVDIVMSHNIYAHREDPVIEACAGRSYSASDIESGVFGQDLEDGISCGSGFGTISGSDTQSLSRDPEFVHMPDVAVSSALSSESTTLVSVNVFIDANYPWQGYSVGDYIELDNDNTLRQITFVDQPELRFDNDPLPQVYSGRRGDGKGVRIVDWGSALFNTGDDYSLIAEGPAVDAGTIIPEVHCPTADDDPLNPMDPDADCCHWFGQAPDIGFSEYSEGGQGLVFADDFESGNTGAWSG